MEIRHDIVHRNGKDLSGREHFLKKKDIMILIGLVRGLAKKLNNDIFEKVNSHNAGKVDNDDIIDDDPSIF